jgi:hypothetical protein
MARHACDGIPLVVAAVLFVAVLLLVAVPQLDLTGDEPHYLILTHSLLTDGDLDLANNYSEQDYAAWYRYGKLDPHAFDYRGNGRNYSIHGIGLPLLMLPSYAALRADPLLAARLTMVPVAALLSLEVFLLALDVFRRRRLAWLAWGIATLTTPMLFYSSQVYPEVPAALLLTLGMRQLLRLPARGAMWRLGIIVALLPWFHVRYAAFSVALFAVALGRVAPWHAGLKRTIPLLATVIIGSAAFLILYTTWYGSPLPSAQYETYTRGVVTMRSLLQGAADLFWEREYGLLPLAPVFLLAVSGVVLACLHASTILIEGIAIIAIYLAMTVWAGVAFTVGPGFSLPGRLLVPVIAPLALLVTAWAAGHRVAEMIVGLGLVASLLLALMALRDPLPVYPNDGLVTTPILWRLQWAFPSLAYQPRHSYRATEGGHLTGHTEPDPADPALSVAAGVPGLDDESYLVCGLTGPLLPGAARLEVELMAEGAPADAVVARLAVFANGTSRTLAWRELYGRDLPGGKYTWETVDLPVDGPLVAEAKVYYTGAAALRVRAVQLTQTRIWPSYTGYAIPAALTLAAAVLGIMAAWRQPQPPRAVISIDSARR